MGFSRTFQDVGGAASSSQIIKGVQEITGQISGAVTTLDVTITSVNTAYTVLYGSRTGASGNADSKSAATYELTSSTNVRFTRGEDAGSSSLYKLFVTEYQPTAVKSLQTAQISVSAVSVNAVITSVTVSKSYIIGGGFYNLNLANVVDNFDVNWAFNSSTSINATINTVYDHKARYQVLELY